MEKKGGQRAHDDHQRQRPEGEDVGRAGVRRLEGQLPAAEEAEYEGGAGRRRVLQRPDGAVQDQEHLFEEDEFKQQDGGAELQRQPDGDQPRLLAPRNPGPVLRQQPRNRDEAKKP